MRDEEIFAEKHDDSTTEREEQHAREKNRLSTKIGSAIYKTLMYLLYHSDFSEAERGQKYVS